MAKRFVEVLQVKEPEMVRSGQRIIADANEEVEMSNSGRARDAVFGANICWLISSINGSRVSIFMEVGLM